MNTTNDLRKMIKATESVTYDSKHLSLQWLQKSSIRLNIHFPYLKCFILRTHQIVLLWMYMSLEITGKHTIKTDLHMDVFTIHVHGTGMQSGNVCFWNNMSEKHLSILAKSSSKFRYILIDFPASAIGMPITHRICDFCLQTASLLRGHWNNIFFFCMKLTW